MKKSSLKQTSLVTAIVPGSTQVIGAKIFESNESHVMNITVNSRDRLAFAPLQTSLIKSYSTQSRRGDNITASFTIVPMDTSKNNKRKSVESAFKQSMKASTDVNQKLYPGSGLLMPRLPKDLEEELTFEEFMSKMIKDRDYESMYKKIYGKAPTEDEEYIRFKTVMLADPLNDKLIDFRKDENIDIVELTRDQYLEYRENRVELKYAYAKYGYERIKIYHNPNRKGLYELHLFKPEKKLDKDQMFQMNKIKYQLRNSLGLSPENVEELKNLKQEHEKKKLKRKELEIQKMEEKLVEKNKLIEEREKPLMQRVKELTLKLASDSKSKHPKDKNSQSKIDMIQLNPDTEYSHSKNNASSNNIYDDNAGDNNLSIITEIRDIQSETNESSAKILSQEELAESEDSRHIEDRYYTKDMDSDSLPNDNNSDLDIIREFLSDDSKLERIAKELGVPATLLKSIYLEGGLQEMEEYEAMRGDEEIDDGLENLTDEQVTTLAKSLTGKTRFDIDLTKRVVKESYSSNQGTVEVTQSDSKSKPVLKYTFEDVFDKLYAMSPEERLLELREKFALMSIGMVTLPYHVYRMAKNILREIPRDDLFRAAKVVATVIRIRMGGFGKNFERKSLNTKVDPTDLESEQVRILRELKSHQKELQLNETGKYSQVEIAAMNLDDKQNLKLSYDLNESAAYIALRLPGTYAVNTQVMTEISKRLPDWQPSSLLDFGAGPGASILAANEIWGDNLKDILAIEPSTANMDNAIKITKDVRAPIAWRRYLTDHFRRRYDLVTASFVLNEIPDKEKRLQTLESLWNVTGGVLVIVDHGTPLGFNLIREAREFILSRSDVEEMEPTILAPCPHDSVCPMAGTKWCHFRQRIERPDFLRQVKNRALLNKDSRLTRSYEDEDFSYIVIRRKGLTGLAPIEEVKEKENERLRELRSKKKLNKDKERVRMEMMLYRRKLARESHSWPRLIASSNFLVRKVSMNMCTPQGALVQGEIYPKTIGRKNGYRLARIARRGDLFSFPRRLIDPNKPSSRELYLAKTMNKVRRERAEKAKMMQLIEEYELIPKREERIAAAQKRWKKIKEHWENPKDDRSFSALKNSSNKSDAEALFDKESQKQAESIEIESKEAASAPKEYHSEKTHEATLNSKQNEKKKNPKLVSNGKKLHFIYAKGKKRDRL